MTADRRWVAEWVAFVVRLSRLKRGMLMPVETLVAADEAVFDLDLESIVESHSHVEKPLGWEAAGTGTCPTYTWAGTCGFTCGGITGSPCAC